MAAAAVVFEVLSSFFFLSADSGVVPRWKETNGLTPPSVIIVLCAAATTRQRSPGGEKRSRGIDGFLAATADGGLMTWDWLVALR